MVVGGSTSKPWHPKWWYQSAPTWLRWAVLVVPGLGLGLLAWVGHLTRGCADLHFAVAFGNTPTRVRELTAEGCSISQGDIRTAMWVDCAAALLYGLGLALVLLAHWRHGWRSRRQGAFGVAWKAALVPVAAGACDVLENLGVIGAVRVEGQPGAVSLDSWAASLIATAGITKWILVWLTMLALTLTLYGVFRFRKLELRAWSIADAEPQVIPPTSPPKGTAVCLSGGGIRSAAFSWGALAQLEKRGELADAAAIYSVSGGGYAASAWTSADPAWRASIEGGFHQLTPAAPGEQPRTPFQHLSRNHRYLSSRRGGLGLSLAKALLSTVVNLTVIAAGLVVVATPLALLSRSRFGAVKSAVADTDALAGTMQPGDIRAGAWLPVLWLLALAAAAVLISLMLRKGRRGVLVAAAIIAALAATVATATIVVPWLAHRLRQIWDKSWWAALPAAITWVGGVLLAAIRPRLSKIAIRLGGVVSGAAMVYALVYVVRRGVAGDAHPGWDWLPDAWDDGWQWPALFLGAIVLLVAVDLTGVQWWSLHPLYRNRLAGAFVTGANADGTVTARDWRSWPRWSTLPAAGPTHVVCAATHRRENTVTGVRSVSFRFERDGVTIHEPVLVDKPTGGNPHDQFQHVGVNKYQQSAVWLDSSVGAKGQRNSRRSHLKATQIAAAAMSGAAFNSAMGRQSKGSTDSLLAVLNLRLGVWLPNPRFKTKGASAFPRAGLRYLFHEVVGHFDLEDPFVHVSDGGHWENLGLTEALRDRHKRVVVIDATGGTVDPPSEGKAGHGFASLREAIDLARIELATEVVLDVAPMRPDATTGRAEQNWQIGTIVYHRDRVHDWTTCSTDPRCRKGTLVFVKAVICDRTPDDVLAYANTDRDFPDYPTGDQFLTDEQFMALVGLGRSATKNALDEPYGG